MWRIWENVFPFSAWPQKKSPRSEAFATLDVILPNRKGIHDLKIKVDTGAQGNTLPLRTFQQMFPEWVDQNGHPRPGTTQKESAILTAYNGSSIPQHGSVGIHCAYKGEWRYIKSYVVPSNGPTILGLPSLQELKLVTLYCPIQITKYTPLNDITATPAAPPKHTPINSTRYLIEAYPEQFDRIGDFAEEYHIVLRPNNHPMIHAPRKCPIHMRDEIKAELEKMMFHGIIQNWMSQRTDWTALCMCARTTENFAYA